MRHLNLLPGRPPVPRTSMLTMHITLTTSLHPDTGNYETAQALLTIQTNMRIPRSSKPTFDSCHSACGSIFKHSCSCSAFYTFDNHACRKLPQGLPGRSSCYPKIWNRCISFLMPCLLFPSSTAVKPGAESQAARNLVRRFCSQPYRPSIMDPCLESTAPR